MNEIIKKNALTFGLISGIISILTYTLIYVINVEYFVSVWLGLAGLAISITLACILLARTKKELKGNLSFKEAFTTYFIMALISLAIATTFSIILFNLIDPTLKVTLKELTLKKTASLMGQFGAPQSEINKALKTVADTDQFSVFAQLKGILTSIVVSSIFGLILAAFFKTPNRQDI